MKNNIVGVGMGFSKIDFQDINLITFDDYTSLLDYDIVIMDLNNILAGYAFDRPYQGKRNLDRHSSFLFMDDFRRRKQEIAEILKLGKTVYVILPIEKEFFVYTGGQKYSGTGKKRQIMNMVKSVNLLDLLPIELQLTIGMGSKISPTNDNFYDRLFGIKEIDYTYNYYFESEENGVPIAFIANTKKCISKAFTFGDGHLIIIPTIFETSLYQTDEIYRKAINSFLETIDSFQEELKSNLRDMSFPSWVKKYSILNEGEIAGEINRVEKKIEEMNQEKLQLNNQLEEVQKYKLALTTSGSELEKIVYTILEKLGFVALRVKLSHAYGLFRFKEKFVIIETKGVNGRSTEKHAAQLEKWISGFIGEKEAIPKGILVVNAFKNQDIASRTEKFFSDKMLDYSVKRNHCLISTTQLLCLYIECQKTPEHKNELIEEFIQSIGIYHKFDDWSKYLLTDGKK